MNKKELHNMKLLEATDELIKLAKEDVKKYMDSNREVFYEYCCLLPCFYG